ncbi:hypothetical protein BCD_1714 (plasmid) [Borrelia crocidurae DOU]|uniref:Uncharacterized protein n=1 Tax=Borrelia crocidurae DOU TaxID=1293575 RepID=W5SLN3_9SPIR|nr:hypothetical protein BCD_1714 [Borrelia crocidurae DOU]
MKNCYIGVRLTDFVSKFIYKIENFLNKFISIYFLLSMHLLYVEIGKKDERNEGR